MKTKRDTINWGDTWKETSFVLNNQREAHVRRYNLVIKDKRRQTKGHIIKRRQNKILKDKGRHMKGDRILQ